MCYKMSYSGIIIIIRQIKNTVRDDVQKKCWNVFIQN